ncbi:MAG: redoxin domain-containing protein [bacterium]|nr:redoxin domain-containing protein [bacterium]
MKLSHILLGIIAVGLALTLALHATSSRAENLAKSRTLAGPAAVGMPAPDFRARDENGVEHRLADYRDRLVVLEWTNSNCPFVARHYRKDAMEKLAKKLGAKGVTWLAVNSTHSNTAAETVAWRDSQGFEYPTLQDNDGTLGRLFGARTTPHMFVIGPKGLLRYAGAIDNDPRGRVESPRNYVDEGISSLLAGSTPDPGSTQPYGCSVKYERR